MKVTPELLLAYVDNQLDGTQKESVEQAVRHSAHLQEQLQLLQASELPFRAAYEAQSVPPLPDSLSNSIEALSIVPEKAPKPVSQIGLAACFLMVFISGFFASKGAQWFHSKPGHEVWAATVASYHELYVRETVALSSSTLREGDEWRIQLNGSTDLTHIIPDLRSMGYRFVRAQQLGYSGQPLTQLVYLKETGKPLALCFMADGNDDFERFEKAYDSVNAVIWRGSGLRYIVVADEPMKQLIEVEQTLRI